MIKPSYTEVPLGLSLRDAFDPLNGAGTFDATGTDFAFPRINADMKSFFDSAYVIGGGQLATSAVISLGAKRALGFGFAMPTDVTEREVEFISCSILCGAASALSFAGYAGSFRDFPGTAVPGDFRLFNLLSYQSSPAGHSFSGVLRPSTALVNQDALAVGLVAGILIYNPGSSTVTITGLCMSMEHTHFAKPDDGEFGVLVVQ